MIRNKIFIFLLFLGISCTKINHSSDEPVQLDSYIFFDEGTVKTKGNLLTGTALPTSAGTSYGVMGLRGTSNTQVFGVYASGNTSTTGNKFKHNNVAYVYRPAANENFTYEKLVLWTNEPHKFCAYYPYFASCVTGLVADDAATSGVDPYLSYTQPTTLAGMTTDLLTAYTEASYNANASATQNMVGLNFKHRLFAFNVLLKNTSGTKMVIKEAILTITSPDGAKLYFNGQVTPNTSTTTITHNYVVRGSDYTLGSGTVASPNSIYLNENHFLLLPCSSLNIDFEMTFVNIWGEEVVWNINGDITPPTPEGAGFVAGNKYDLVLTRKVINDNVTFVPSVEDWGSMADIEHNFE